MFKKRSKFGTFVDKNLGYGGQEKIRESSGLNRDTVTKACNDPDYKPKGGTLKSFLSAAKELTGKEVKKNDFW